MSEIARERTPSFAPVLRYLVQVGPGFSHPSKFGLTSGVEVWADHTIQFSNHGDAAKYARKVGGEVVKIRIRATREKIKGPR